MELLSLMDRFRTSFRGLPETAAKVEDILPFSLIGEHVSFIYNFINKDLDSNLFVGSNRGKKNADKAKIFREVGNKAFKSEDYVEALEFYLESVAWCPKNSEELALAYGNRSAAFFRLNDFRSSLVDINRAVKGKKMLDDKWVKKLQVRKQNCIKNIRSKISMEGNEQFDEDSVEIDFDTKYPLPKVNFKNKLIPNASEKVKICVNDEMGRHVVAVKDINPGEILSIEKSYASVLFKRFHHTHCWHCHVRTVSLIPCDSCSLAMFCSLSCQKKAFNLYHRTECQIVQIAPLFFEDYPVENVALRIFLIATKQGAALKNFRKHSIYGKPFREKYSDFQGKFISEDYFSVHNLIDCFKEGDLDRLLSKGINATVLLRILKESSFFMKIDEKNRSNSNELTELESYAGTLLLKYLYIIQMNGHAYDETFKLRQNRLAIRQIGYGLFPFHSLINHSCDANVMRIHDRNRLILRATQPIPAGEQIFDWYVKHESAKTRQEFLKKNYFFECHCVICKFDSPSYLTLVYTSPDYKSAECKKNKRTIEKYSKKFRKIMSGTIDVLEDEENLKFFCDYLTLLHKNIKKPWMEYTSCQKIIEELVSRQHLFYTVNEVIIL